MIQAFFDLGLILRLQYKGRVAPPLRPTRVAGVWGYLGCLWHKVLSRVDEDLEGIRLIVNASATVCRYLEQIKMRWDIGGIVKRYATLLISTGRTSAVGRAAWAKQGTGLKVRWWRYRYICLSLSRSLLAIESVRATNIEE